MTIPLQGSAGALFTRCGKIGATVKNAKAHQATQLTALTDPTVGVEGQFLGEPDLQAVVGAGYISALTGPETVGPLGQQLAQATFNRMVFRDNPRVNQTLTQANLLASIQEVIRQMKLAGATVLRQTVAGTAGAFTGAGTGVALISVLRPYDGNPLENAFAESLQLLCSADSYTGGATAGNENFLLTGQGGQPDVFAFNWPLGSNASQSLAAVDGDKSNVAGNLLTNSGFGAFTGNTPNNFTVVTGVAGTHFKKNSGIIYSAGNSLQLIGDGSTKTEFRQQFGLAAGTGAALSPLTQYGCNVWLRTDGGGAASGVLAFDLCDQFGVAVLDKAGVACSFAVNATALNTVWTPFGGAFRTPTVLPSPVFWRLKETTALANLANVYVDKGSLTLMGQAYTGGPFAAVFAGNVPFQANDYAFLTVTNSRGAGGTLATWQTLLYQLLGGTAAQNEILFPSSSSPVIPDSLIA